MTKLLLDKKYRLTLILVAIICLLVLYVFVVYPVYEHWQEIDREVTVSKQRYLKHRALLERIDKYNVIYDRFKNELQASGNQEEIAALFMKDLEGFAASTGLTIIDIKILPKLYEKNAIRFLVEAQMEAEISPFIAFLKAMAATDKLIIAERLTVERKGPSEPTLSIHAVFSMTKTV
ncbi:MAG: hypothetical protein JW938_00290 [Candidatus Omnitrophica bacterium]|nr:hypothetical protein [Candidatus Omnitrophota bacterium]